VQRAKAFVNQIKKIGLQAALPKGNFVHQCTICLQQTDWPEQVCPWCSLDIGWNRFPCPNCALPKEPMLSCCCTTPSWLRCYSATLYEYPAVQLLSELKVGLRKQRAITIAYLLEQYLDAARHSPLPEQIIPVPSTPSALKRRGFNPVELIANNLSDRYRARLTPEVFISEDQQEAKQLTKQARERRNPFKIMHRPAQHIAILDDVMTTGHTLKAATQLLKKHGASTVEVWTFTRALPKEYYDIAIVQE